MGTIAGLQRRCAGSAADG